MAALGQGLLGRTLRGLLLLTVVLPAHGQSDQGYVGAETCGKCHAEINHQWAQSLHSKVMQLATERSVEGDFAQRTVVLRGSTYLLRYRNGNYYITESDLTGKPWEHRVEYTLGKRRVQHYLSTLPDGRIVVIPPTWDNAAKKWSHDIDIKNPEEDSGAQVQIWNKSCYSCHVSQERKNFEVQQVRYHTTWQDFGINCERCHGPGGEHGAKAAGANLSNAGTRAVVKSTIVNPARLDSVRNTMICAQCHSFRDIYVDGFKAGADYYDFFLPVMEHRLPPSDEPAYWPDGRPRWLSNDAIAFWQSQCFLKGGATCGACHFRPHNVDVDRNPQLRPDNNALCTRCHKAIAARISSHTHHRRDSSGSSCVECHMPPTVIGINSRMRDHSMSIPVPENTIRHGIPNACNLCHKDKDAKWALRQMNAWYGDQSRQKLIRRADAFTAGRRGDLAAIPALLQILADPSEGAFIRANAVGYLASFPDSPSAYDAVLHSFSDPEPLVRATAALEIRPRAAQREAVAPQLASLLHDSTRTVQMSAAIGLVAMGVRQVPGEDGEWFARAKELYQTRAELNSDNAQQQLAAGKFFYLAGNMDAAVAALDACLKLDPAIPAQYYLARALAEKGDSKAARQVLATIPRDDPQYTRAQQLLASLEASAANQKDAPQTGNVTQDNPNARALFLDGQLQYQGENYLAALQQLEQALRLTPEAEWGTKAQIYRAICLEKLGRAQEAEAAMQALSGSTAGRDDVDLQLAFAELLYDTGRAEEALKRIDGIIAVAPRAPTAYFWRAKVLLELHRTDEAARAAEESVRLLPEAPFAHNLLIKIYQVQGRAKEAAREAEWLRDYQRRIESR
jgi:predicted CXXCH cytochrome family protein